MRRKICLILILFAMQLPSAELPKNFVYVRDMIPNATVDLRYLGSHNFIGHPIDGYEADKVILTRDAATALKKVQKELNQYGLGIKIFDTYRPQRAVDHFVRWAKVLDDTVNRQEFYPTVDKKNLFKKGFIAAKSSHSRGSTVDLTIIDLKTKKELDMGSGFDFFGKLSWIITPKTISPEARANRMLLQTLMKKHGFNNYAKEWWHFTLNNEPFPDTYFDFPVR